MTCRCGKNARAQLYCHRTDCGPSIAAQMSDIKEDHDTREQAHATVSQDVAKVRDHLRNNRTTEREAADLHDAAVRSLTDHYTAKSLKRD